MSHDKHQKINEVECSSCGAKYDFLDILTTIANEGLEVHETESYCLDCSRNIDNLYRQEQEKRKINEIEEQLVRLENEMPHHKHEKIIDKLISMLEDEDNRKDEYINDTITLAQSLVMIAKVEMEKASIQMKHQISDNQFNEEWRFAELMGMVESCKRDMNDWMEKTAFVSDGIKEICVEEQVLFEILPWKDYNG